MRTKMMMAALAATMALSATPAAAQYDRYGYDQNGYNRDGYNRNGYNRDGYDRHHTYYGRRQDCRRSNGTTGTIAGAVGGGLIGNAVGGGALGTIAGAGGGALLGRHLDKKHDEAQNRRNGC